MRVLLHWQRSFHAKSGHMFPVIVMRTPRPLGKTKNKSIMAVHIDKWLMIEVQTYHD